MGAALASLVLIGVDGWLLYAGVVAAGGILGVAYHRPSDVPEVPAGVSFGLFVYFGLLAGFGAQSAAENWGASLGSAELLNGAHVVGFVGFVVWMNAIIEAGAARASSDESRRIRELEESNEALLDRLAKMEGNDY